MWSISIFCTFEGEKKTILPNEKSYSNNIAKILRHFLYGLEIIFVILYLDFDCGASMNRFLSKFLTCKRKCVRENIVYLKQGAILLRF